MRRIIDYHRELRITNLESLPAGTGARYLLAIESIYDGEFIAKQWKRVIPQTTKRGEVIIRFP